MILDLDEDGNSTAAASVPSGIPGVAAIFQDPLSQGGIRIPGFSHRGFQPGGVATQLPNGVLAVQHWIFPPPSYW